MSNAMTLFGNQAQLPAWMANVEMDATTKALSGGNGGSSRRISIEGGVFRMIVNGEEQAVNEDRAMNIVIVSAALAINRQYYEGTYVKGVSVPPTCWSPDGKKPAADVEQPQSSSCDSCPQNIAGSGQGESRACRFQQRLAVVLEGEIGGPVYQLALPATSLFGKGEANNTKLPLQAYSRFLVMNNAPITGVVTEMRFDTTAATPKLTFKAVRPLTKAEYDVSQEQGASDEAIAAVTMTVFKADQKKAVPAPRAKPVAAVVEEEDEVPTPKAKAKPAVADDEGDEPMVTSKAKPAVVAPAGKRPVSAVVAEWDD
jgi:hypothetical protein